MRRVSVIGAVVLLLVLAATPASARTVRTVEDLVGQGLGGVTVGSVELTRGPGGLHIKASMPTPAPGSYTYPAGAVGGGGPEVFTLWVFVFPDPAACGDDGCAGLGDVAASGGGVFGVAGHASGGGTLTLSGHVGANSEPFALNHLTNPDGAEVHVAVAPHGSLDPNQMPAQIKTPIGGPAVWWIALFG